MTSLFQDLRLGVRILLKDRGFAAVTIATLALGIGATVAVFSVVWRVLLAPLPFPDADRIMVVWETQTGSEYRRMVAAPPNVDDWARSSQRFERLGMYATATYTVSDGERSDTLDGAQVTASLLETVRVAPLIGRTLTVADQTNKGTTPILVSERLWRDWFNASPAAIGRIITLDGRRVEVAGVMPASFTFPPPLTFVGLTADRPHDLWVPFQPLDIRGAHYVMALGRLRPGVTPNQADEELKAIAGRIAEEHPQNKGWSVQIVPLQEELAAPVRPGLGLLLAGVAVVLLLACANIANLHLARGTYRRREMAIRAALGAGRPRLVRQLLAESLVATSAGGAVGLLLASWAVRLAVTFGPADVPRLATTTIDGRAVLFALGITLASALLVAMLPAFVGTGARPVESLRERATTGGSARLQPLLVSGEIAVALVLLVVALGLIGAFVKLRRIDLGFDPSSVVSMRLTLVGERYRDPAQRTQFFDRLFERLQAGGGFERVGGSDAIPLSGSRQGSSVWRSGEVERQDNGVSTRYSFVTPGYFETVRIPVLSGRGFARDEPGRPAPVVVNEACAKRLFGNGEPLGRRIRVGFEQELRVIVGIVGDERHVAPGRAPDANVYIPASQYGWTTRLTVVARATVPPDAALARLRAAVREVDPAIAPYELRTLQAMAVDVVATERFVMLLLAVFAGLALVLCAVGVYGVMSYFVGQQQMEFGIRVALGASPAALARLVVVRIARLAAGGVGLGLLLTALARPLMGGLVGPQAAVDPAIVAAAAAVLTIVALLAGARPAVRAMRVDPVATIKG